MNKQKFYLLLVFYPIQAVALTALIFTNPNWLLLFIGWILFCGLGSAVTLHRIVSHNSIKVKKHLRNPLLLLGTLCVQGSPLWWASIHRERHHKNSDQKGDPHRPKDGLFHSYIGWIHDKRNGETNLRNVKDILKVRFNLFLYRYNNHIIWSVFTVGSLIDFHSMVWLWVIPAALSYHQESIVNVFCHTGKAGYKNYNLNDNSMNLPLLSLFTWGQALHNNHHAKPYNYNFRKKGKMEFDPSVIFLPFIKEKEV